MESQSDSETPKAASLPEANIPEEAFGDGTYNSLSCRDKNSIYLGGYGHLYQVNSASGEIENTLLPSSNMLGAAAYGEYIYYIEINLGENGLSSSLVRVKKDGSGKESLTELDPGSYDLKIYGQSISVSYQTIQDNRVCSLFLYYELDEEGRLCSEAVPAESICGDFADADGNRLDFLIDPLFSLQDCGNIYQYLQMEDSVKVHILKENGDVLEKKLACSVPPKVINGNLVYYDETGKCLSLYQPDEDAISPLFEATDAEKTEVLNCDNKWIYFGIYENEDGANMIVYRINMGNKEAESLFETSGTEIRYFSVYDGMCYYGTDTGWIRHSLNFADDIIEYPGF
ncbi:MAG: DUF5050 domain-containing protein [Eubacteriales bacterium]|nr:DUF5050 domain-containing protein [Eubacteriales bacterium]